MLHWRFGCLLVFLASMLLSYKPVSCAIQLAADSGEACSWPKEQEPQCWCFRLAVLALSHSHHDSEPCLGSHVPVQNHVGILDTHSVGCAGVQLKEATLATHYVPYHLLPELESELQQLGTQASSRKAVHELLAKCEVGSKLLWSPCCARNRLAVMCAGSLHG